MGLLADANLGALKDEKFTRMVIGAVSICGIAPFGWFELIDPTTVYWTIIGIGGLVTGLPLVNVVQDTINKKTNKESKS